MLDGPGLVGRVVQDEKVLPVEIVHLAVLEVQADGEIGLELVLEAEDELGGLFGGALTHLKCN
jgi:hypothetical protein